LANRAGENSYPGSQAIFKATLRRGTIDGVDRNRNYYFKPVKPCSRLKSAYFWSMLHRRNSGVISEPALPKKLCGSLDCVTLKSG